MKRVGQCRGYEQSFKDISVEDVIVDNNAAGGTRSEHEAFDSIAHDEEISSSKAVYEDIVGEDNEGQDAVFVGYRESTPEEDMRDAATTAARKKTSNSKSSSFEDENARPSFDVISMPKGGFKTTIVEYVAEEKSRRADDENSRVNTIRRQNPHAESGEVAKVKYPQDVAKLRRGVKLFMKFGLSWGGCSGSMVSDFHVLTAGYCVHDQSNGWVSSILVVPSMTDNVIPKGDDRDNIDQYYGHAYAANVCCLNGWVVDEDFDHDIAIITLDRKIGQYTGYFPKTTSTPQTGWSYSVGYPGWSPYDGMFMYVVSSTTYMVLINHAAWGGDLSMRIDVIVQAAQNICMVSCPTVQVLPRIILITTLESPVVVSLGLMMSL